MKEQTLKVILEILHDRFNLDDFDQVEFVMEYEKRTGEKIPNAWLTAFQGTMKTVNIKQKNNKSIKVE